MTFPRFEIDVCGFGSINVDYVVPGPTHDQYFDELSEGEERAVTDPEELADHIAGLDRPRMNIGGSSVNAIHALRVIDPRLRLSIVGPVGKLPPRVSLEELSGIDLKDVVHYNGYANACVSVVVGAERKLRPYNDPDGVRQLLVERRAATVQALSRARVVHVSSLVVPGAGELVAGILADVRAATDDGTRISVDLGLPWARERAVARAILPHASTLLLSEEEIRELLPGLPTPLLREDEHAAIGRLLREYGCAPDTITILKRRAQPESADEPVPEPRPRVGGVMYHREVGESNLLRDEVLRDGLDKSQIVDSTGAGDFFAAAVLAEAVSSHARAVQTLTFATALARHKFGHTAATAYEDLERVLYCDTVPATAGKIFVSHAHKDAAIVEALLDAMTAGGGDRARAFFCTSQPDTAVSWGQALGPAVIGNLRAASRVLFVVTPNFMKSDACQRELGGAQVLRAPMVPLKHPCFRTWASMELPIAFHRGARLESEDELKSLRDDLAQHFGWQHASLREWHAAMQRLRAALGVGLDSADV